MKHIILYNNFVSKRATEMNTYDELSYTYSRQKSKQNIINIVDKIIFCNFASTCECKF